MKSFGFLVLLLASTGCSTECQQLCSDWYDYQTGNCGSVDVDDERVRCISDYASRLVSEAELVECTGRMEQISGLESGDSSCCPGAATADCPWVQDDETSAR